MSITNRFMRSLAVIFSSILLLSTTSCLPPEYWAKDAQERVTPGMTREEVLNALGPPTYEEWEAAANNYSLNYEFHPAATIASAVGISLLAITVIGLIFVTATSVSIPSSYEVHERTSGFIIRFDQADKVTEILQVRRLPGP